MTTKVNKDIKLELTNATILKIHREGKFNEFIEIFSVIEQNGIDGIIKALQFLSTNSQGKELTEEEIGDLIVNEGLLKLQALVIEELGKPIFGAEIAKQKAQEIRKKLSTI